jgi:thioredoxin-related protein
MKKLLCALVGFWLAGQAVAAESAWLTSVPQALDQAKRENKMVLLDFTGSDWCGWCKKLVAETFSKPDFLEYASRNLVLVEIDFPKRTTQSAELSQANSALKAKYEVKGFPTLVVLNAEGGVLWKKVGYLAGGPPAMIAKLDGLRGKPAAEAPAVSVTAKPVMPIPVQWPAPPPRQPGDEPRLQGIFYSSHPSIILEGKNCGEGDSVQGMRVLKIAPDKVTVEWNGQTKILRMN